MAEMQNTTLASRQLVGVEFEQVSNLPEKKKYPKIYQILGMVKQCQFRPKCDVLFEMFSFSTPAALF